MMHKLQVKEHLRNRALYLPVTTPLLGGEWKQRLFCQYNRHKQLRDALQERPNIFKPLVYITLPIACILLVSAAHFGLLHSSHWLENIVSAANFRVPAIGLREILLFAAMVNGLTFLIRRRVLS